MIIEKRAFTCTHLGLVVLVAAGMLHQFAVLVVEAVAVFVAVLEPVDLVPALAVVLGRVAVRLLRALHQNDSACVCVCVWCMCARCALVFEVKMNQSKFTDF